jgi:hypothetical protein
MSNYYTQFKKYIDEENLYGKKILLYDFERIIRILFGLGGRNKTINRWSNNLQDVGYIKIEKDDENRPMVTIMSKKELK